MKRLFMICVVLLGTLWVQAQPRGKALYNAMTSGGALIQMQGNAMMRWLPNKPMYYVYETGKGEQKTDKPQWYAVDPVTEMRTLLFNEAERNALISQYGTLAGKTVTEIPFNSFAFEKDGDAISFTTDKRDFLFDLKTLQLRELKHPEVKQQPFTDGLMRNMPGSQLWNGEYSPDFNWFAYVVDYDLYVADTRNGKVYRITQDGNENRFNGRPNWVYPEEFDQLTAYWWSPDSKKLAFYQSDESAVHKYPLVKDNIAEAELELQSYPKAGEPNPTVNLFIADIPSGKKVQVVTNSTADNYIVRPIWTPNSQELTFQRLNRQQNVLELLAANPKNGQIRTILKEEENEFVNLQDDYQFFKDGERFLWSSERSGYRQLYLSNLKTGALTQLTAGEKPVVGATRLDESDGWLYYTVNSNLGMETEFVRTKLDGSGTQTLTTVSGSHNIMMDNTASFYVDMFSNWTTPSTANLHRADGSLVRNLMKGDPQKLEALKLEEPELVIFKAADGVTNLPGILYKPAGYDPNKKYPLLISVYGGPHSKAIRNSFSKQGSLQALAQLGYIVWTADNRGLTGRGKAFETATYRKLGQVDLADQTAGVRAVCEQFSFIDCSRVGVFGHSYGGYMTSIMLLKEPDVYHVGVAGAPVTDWRNYDTIYTERYMFTPQANKEGYDNGSAMKYAANLKGKLLLVHGTIDNNVHPGNTMQLIEALVKANKKFDLKMYPLNRHGIMGAFGKHYTQSRLDYFEENLKPQPVE